MKLNKCGEYMKIIDNGKTVTKFSGGDFGDYNTCYGSHWITINSQSKYNKLKKIELEIKHLNHDHSSLICYPIYIGFSCSEQRINEQFVQDIEKQKKSENWKLDKTNINCAYASSGKFWFNDRNIIKIQVGFRHALFLESNGDCWGFGDNSCQQLGIDGMTQLKLPKLLSYKIKIKDITSGYQHNLAIDYSNKAYSWGNNLRGQCGNDLSFGDRNNGPQLIGHLQDYDIIDIQCGYEHSYCKTECGRHYLFGSNMYYECMRYDDRSPVKLPFCINSVIDQEINNKGKCKKIIKSVSLGYNNTKIILCDDDCKL